MASPAVASLVEGGKPHLCQEVEAAVCLSCRGGEEGGGRANIAGRKMGEDGEISLSLLIQSYLLDFK